MPKKDLYEQLVRGYEFMLGAMPNHDQFLEALRKSFSEEDIRLVLLLPLAGDIPIASLVKKAAKIGIPEERVYEIVRRLVPEGLIASYIKPEDSDGDAIAYPTAAPLVDMKHTGRVVARGDIVSMSEMQVRKHEDDLMRQAAAVWMNAMTEDAARSIPTRTPYFRVIPYEGSITRQPSYGDVTLDAPVPDPRQVLPFDIVSEMVKKQPVMAVAECYCRRTKIIMGEPCDHPLETCLYFNGLALLQMETGRARRIDVEEALQILERAEEAGLVHNISNSGGKISTICNCCTCSCGAMKSLKMGGRNAANVSRYRAVVNTETCIMCGECEAACPMEAIHMEDDILIDAVRCIGCGLCVRTCPEGSLSMTLREDQPKIYEELPKLTRQITREAVVGLVKKKIFGRY